MYEKSMKKQLGIIFIILIEILTLSKSVSAYLFPGTATAMIGSMWPLIVVFFITIGTFLVKHFWKPIKKNISKVIKSKNKKEQVSNEGIESETISTKIESQKLP